MYLFVFETAISAVVVFSYRNSEIRLFHKTFKTAPAVRDTGGSCGRYKIEFWLQILNPKTTNTGSRPSHIFMCVLMSCGLCFVKLCGFSRELCRRRKTPETSANCVNMTEPIADELSRAQSPTPARRSIWDILSSTSIETGRSDFGVYVKTSGRPTSAGNTRGKPGFLIGKTLFG